MIYSIVRAAYSATVNQWNPDLYLDSVCPAAWNILTLEVSLALPPSSRFTLPGLVSSSHVFLARRNQSVGLGQAYARSSDMAVEFAEQLVDRFGECSRGLETESPRFPRRVRTVELWDTCRLPRHRLPLILGSCHHAV